MSNTNPVRSTRRVMLTVAPSGMADTTPPAPWWWLALRRFAIQVAVVAPFVIDAAINLVQTGQIQVPSKYAALVSVLIILVQTAMKAVKEQDNAAATRQLQAQGVPVGQFWHPAVAKDLLDPIRPPSPPSPSGAP